MTSERAETCTAVSTATLDANVSSSVLFDVTNNTAVGRVWSLPDHPVYIIIVIGIISVMGVLSNSAVLAVLLQKKHRKLAANLYLVNLAVGTYVLSCLVLSCRVLSCEKYWQTLLRSQTVTAGAHGVIKSKCVEANLNIMWLYNSGYFVW